MSNPFPFNKSRVDSVLSVRLDSQHDMELLSRVTQKVVEVAYKAVNITFSRGLVDNVLVIVVTQATAQLFVVHLRFVFPSTPATSNLEERRRKGQATQFVCSG